MAFDQDTYRKWILPALGVAETIATRGKSPGTNAMSQEQIFRDAEEGALKKKQIEAQIAEQQSIAQQRALQGQLTPFQIAEAQRNQRRGSEEDAAEKALMEQLGQDTTIPASERAFYKYNPKAYGERLKPTSNVYLPGANGFYTAPAKGAGPVTPTMDSDGNPVIPKQPKAEKSLAEIQAEAEARAKGANAGGPPKPPTEDQSKAANFARRMELAMSDLADVEKSGYDRTTAESSGRAKLPSAMNSSLGQRYSNAEKNFASANLRKESGAVIGAEEMASQEALYFPRYKDSPETIAQKARNRAQAFEGMKAAAGKQFDQVPSMVPQPGPQTDRTVWRRGPNGREYEYDAATKQPTGGIR